MSANSPPGKSNDDETVDRSPIVPPNEPGSGTESISSRIRDWDVDTVRRYLAQKLGLHEPSEPASPSEQVLEEVNIDGIVKWIQSERCKKIITLSGAGISTSAGIPDFRSPETGLYHNLQKYNLPEPQAIFEINFFRQNPKPFFMLAKELYPGSFKPTISHYFIRLLHEKGLLLRHYTQNIDTLERVANIPEEKIVEAHGTFYTSHCLECRKQYNLEFVKERIFADQIPICTECPGVVKPDIVFFGESLPERFQECLQEDFQHCDLLIIMGSSLEVQPFASLIDMARILKIHSSLSIHLSRDTLSLIASNLCSSRDLRLSGFLEYGPKSKDNKRVPDWCPRLLLNREKAGLRSPIMRMLGLGGGLQPDEGVRDVARLGDCDNLTRDLAHRLGWQDELIALVASEHERLEREGVPGPPVELAATVTSDAIDPKLG